MCERSLLILDLDQTLLHSIPTGKGIDQSWKSLLEPPHDYHFTYSDDRGNAVNKALDVYVRPHVTELMAFCRRNTHWLDVVVASTGDEAYVHFAVKALGIQAIAVFSKSAFKKCMVKLTHEYFWF
jgi:hypothetical protein